MASVSQGLVLTTAMVLSSTVLYLAFSKPNIFSPSLLSGNTSSRESDKQVLRSCLCSEGKRRERKEKKMKKKVKFADNVKESCEEGRKAEEEENRVWKSCRNEIPEITKMPPNRIALYNGILRDRARRIDCA
ncbi:cytochrome P450 family protein [Senna tora]|uniref:Cytochrome P450 family protein n=1 Tax=Senna tora TaxID=362788 RepID=A0A834XDH7_9FABA|nr:cytochrome P450 family protein [Senna tora]